MARGAVRIHGMCLVKDEVDVIAETLTAAADWCDAIYVFDNGSSDGTWETVGELARNHPRIVPFTRDPKPFRDGLRAEIWEAFRHRSLVGDWWCRLDADEIYIDEPREFLARVPVRYDGVLASSYQYYFTDVDLERYREDPELYSDDVPVREKCRYYSNNWCELRFARHTADIRWPLESSWPVTIRRIYPELIRLRHYQYRSPQQIQRRIEARTKTWADTGYFGHEEPGRWAAREERSLPGALPAGTPAAPSEPGRWEDRVVASSELHFDALDGSYVAGEEIPGLARKKIASRTRGGGSRWRRWLRRFGV